MPFFRAVPAVFLSILIFIINYGPCSFCDGF
uniref:Uncharacterized protein n=1 Tax=Anguilla anguilla TaxID=7936 RepID=A0A0E9QAN5_ANGAN